MSELKSKHQMMLEIVSEVADITTKLGVVHAVLNRLEEKGLVKSKLGEATQVRGGKRKRYYSVTNAGKSSLIKAKDVRDQIWKTIPNLRLKEI